MGWKNLLKRAYLSFVVATGLVTLGPPTFVNIQDYLNKNQIERKLGNLEEELSDRYGVDIEVWKARSQQSFGPPIPRMQTSLRSFSPYVSLRALEGLEKTLECYPEDLIEDHLLRIEIV